MESESSAKSLLSLFSKSDLSTFTPMTSRDFYKTSPPPNASSKTAAEDQSPEHEHRRKKRRRSPHPVIWTCAEIRALEIYRNSSKKDEVDDDLRDILLPNRSFEEVKAQMARVESTIRKRRKNSKLQDLEKEENEFFVLEEGRRMEEMENDIKERRTGLDNVLGLTKLSGDYGAANAQSVHDIRESRGANDVKSSLDQALGLGVEESEEQRLMRELDEALGLR
jgi:hypothetical protein